MFFQNLNLNSKLFCELVNQNQDQEEELNEFERKEECLIQLKLNILEERKKLVLSNENSEHDESSIATNSKNKISDKDIYEAVTNYECCQRNCLGKGLSGASYLRGDFSFSFKIVNNCRQNILGLISSERISYIREQVASKPLI